MSKEHFYLCWVISKRCRLYARLDDGRLTWTPRLERRNNFPADTIATKMTLAKATAVRAAFFDHWYYDPRYEILHEEDVI